MLVLWLLFLPNSPYIITDLVHLSTRAPIPFWYDMLLLLLSAFNGLALGLISYKQIEVLLFREKKRRARILFRIFIMLSVSYGVYLGRYIRLNSWDAFINPEKVIRGIYESLNVGTIGFVLTFSFFTYVVYSLLRTILPRRSQ